MYLDEKVNFLQHIKEKTSRDNRGIGVTQRLSRILPRHSLITISQLLDLILITVIKFMINPTMKASAAKLKGFSKVLLL